MRKNVSNFITQSNSSLSQYSFLLIIICYFLTHLIIRLLFTSSLEVDEAEQVFLSQEFLLGYNQQPPLYTWIVIVLTKVFGYQMISILTLRIVSLIGIFGIVFLISKKYQKTLLLAVISTLSLLLFFQLSIESLRQTHTVLVTFAVAFLLLSFCKLIDRKTVRNYIVFGIAIALGMLAKYNFVIPLASLFISAILDPTYRKIILNKKICISFLVLGLLITPHTIWLYQNLMNTSQETIGDLATSEDQSYFFTFLPSIWALIKGILSFGGIFMLVLLILFKGNIRFIFKKSSADFLGFIGKFLAISFLILCAILIATKATNAHERWVQPLFFLAPIYIFGKLKTSERLMIRLNKFKKVLLTSSILVLIYVVFSIIIAPSIGFTERINRPYASLSKHLIKNHKNMLESSDLILCDAMDLTGNMKLLMPEYTFDTPHPKTGLFFDSSLNIAVENLVLIGTKENNTALLDHLKNQYNLPFTEEQYRNTFLFDYSKKDEYTFYYTFIQFKN